MNRKRGGLAAHQRDPSLDCSPLRKSVAAFAAEETLVGSQQPVWSPPVGSATSSLRGSGDSCGSSSLHGSGDRIPAHRGSAASSSSSSSDGLGSAAVPQGSAWNPWQEHAVPPPPLPLRRVVAHRPSPSWFSPVLGFGGPASCVWQEEEQRRSVERQQAQQAQWQHAQQPQQQPQEQQAAQVNGRQQPGGQRSIPWYQQGWQQQPRQPQQTAASLHYPGNPFAGEPCFPMAAEPAAAGGAPSSQQHSGSSQSGRRLPPPPRFLLARKAQEAQQQAQQAQQQPALPCSAPPQVQQAGLTSQLSTAGAAAGPADAAQDVQPRGMGPQDASCTAGMHSGHAEQGTSTGDDTRAAPAGAQQQQQPAAAPLPPPLPSAGPTRGAAQPPPPPPPPPPRLAVQPAGAPPPPPPPPARHSAGPAGVPPPPPPPPKAVPKSGLSQPPPAPPSNAAGKVQASMQPSPAPAAAAARPPGPPPVPVAPVGGSALSAIRADELLAAAGRLRKVQPGNGVQEPAGASGSAAADVTASWPAPAADPRAVLLDQIKKGVKLRPVEARKQPPLPPAAAAAPSGPLGQATPSMAELLRKVVEARRVDAGGDSDSDSEWGG